MHLLTLDFETFYDTDYSLSRLTNEAYIRDPRFEVILVGLKMDDRPTFWVSQPQVAAVFAKIPWNETAVLSHHAHFDAAILSWVFGIKPALILDTIPMFRAVYPTESAALSNVAKVLGLQDKGTEVLNAKGKRYRDFNQWELQRYGSYCVGDVDITRQAFDILKIHFPASEVRLMDLTARMFTEPVLHLNPGLLDQAYRDEQERLVKVFAKAFPELLAEAAAAVLQGDAEAWKKLKTPLNSNPQFAQMLANLGVDPPKKLSPAAVKSGLADPELDKDPPIGLLQQIDKKTLAAMRAVTETPHPSEIWTYAFSKSDEEFKHLLEHPDEAVSTLVEARLGVKSTIKETRAKAFLGIASRGEFPIYLKYYGAGTGRFGGGDKVNPQNLNKFCPHCHGEKCPRCSDTGISPLRRAIEAPEGHVIVVRDLSAIEARINFYLAGQEDKVQAYRENKDLYCIAASEVFGREITKEDKKERFLGKSEILGCLGADTLVITHNGMKFINTVTEIDLLWDGDTWVNHEGVVAKGHKYVERRFGITATPDHEIRTPAGWEDWGNVARDESMFQAALAAGSSCGHYIPSLAKDLQTDRVETFDIAEAGPRNRFAIVSSHGPIIAHNCGYGLGWRKYQGMLRIGMLGNKGMLLGEDIAYSLGVSGTGFAYRNSGYVNETLPPGVTFEQHATHCACAQQIIKLFRDNNPMVPKLWDRYHWALGEMLAGACGQIDQRGIIRYDTMGLLLPNGMYIRYVELEAKVSAGQREEYSILKNRKKGERAKVYGGLCCENGTQALARIILTDAILKIDAELQKRNKIWNISPRKWVRKVVHQVHDEILTVAPEPEAEEIYHLKGEIMSTPPAWAPGLPLASEGGWAKQYIK